jgi:glycosyltransferase involved in cell wall biosynthesis
MLVDPKELDGQLRLALRTLLEFDDFRSELGQRARARAVERYSLRNNLDHLLALYHELRPAAGKAVS